MKLSSGWKIGLPAVGLLISPFGYATIHSYLDPGTGAPPGTLGGYSMAAFMDDPSPEGTLLTELSPPPGFPGSGNLVFDRELEHFKVGSTWDTWSHGYTGSVYYDAYSELEMTLPLGTLAFSLYIEPNLKDLFAFKVASGVEEVTLSINGDAGARYVGFYTDNPAEVLETIWVYQTTEDADGFAVGEFMISATVPESGWGVLELLLGACSLAGLGRIFRFNS